MRTFIRATFVLATAAALFACKPKTEAPAPVAAEPEAEESAPAEQTATLRDGNIEACKLTQSAPESADWATSWNPAGSASEVRSIYWSNDVEKTAKASNGQAVPLEVTCSSSDSPSISVNLTARTSKESDIPMGPGTYPITGRQQNEVKPGAFLANVLSFDGRTFDSRKGSITITRFDSDGVAGSFVIDGEELAEGKASIHLEGSFEMPCRGDQLESACTANKSSDTQ